ncbi:MAG: tetratricopeptide repeat protein [Acidobacteriota bacterium]|nr:tetratricopeptide repeat protein [Acidobacteriota bacterium]
MYTTGGEKRAREVILYFEEVRSFFVQASPLRGVTEFPVRIVAFKNARQYELYRMNSIAAAFYTKGRYRDYIVLGDLDPEHLPIAIHEYMHLVVQNSGIKLPVWLNEGWADVYSTLKPIGKKSMIGDLMPGRVQVLLQQKWMPFDALTSVGRDSPAYNEKDRASIFYAESWALTHMLYLSPGYSKNFNKFLLALNSGASTNDACQTAFGKTGAEVFADLQQYLRGNRLYGAVFDAKLSKSEEEATVDQATGFDSALMSADLFAAINKPDRARAGYEALAARNPDRPEIPQSLGYLAWQKQDTEMARTQFEKAFAAGSKDPQLCFDLAMLELQHGDADAKAAAALHRALELKPDYTDARLELGMAELKAGKYPDAIADLKRIQRIDPVRAGRYFNALAYAYAQTGDFPEARKQAEAAKKWDRADGEKEQTESLLRYLDARAQNKQHDERNREVFNREQAEGRPHLARAPAANAIFAPPSPTGPVNPFIAPGQKVLRAEGTAKEVGCEGGLQFTILSSGKLMTFAIPKPEMVLLKHNSDVTFDFICGPQKAFPIAVEYIPAEHQGKVAGDVKMLEF